MASAILDAAQEHEADVIGMSGLLVKSTVIMRENLEEMNARGVSAKWPVLLGGAALTRMYVEQDLASLYEGEDTRDAFRPATMDALVAVKRGVPGATLPELREYRVRARPSARPVDGADEQLPPVRMWPSTTPFPYPRSGATAS